MWRLCESAAILLKMLTQSECLPKILLLSPSPSGSPWEAHKIHHSALLLPPQTRQHKSQHVQDVSLAARWRHLPSQQETGPIPQGCLSLHFKTVLVRLYVWPRYIRAQLRETSQVADLTGDAAWPSLSPDHDTSLALAHSTHLGSQTQILICNSNTWGNGTRHTLYQVTLKLCLNWGFEEEEGKHRQLRP